MDALPMSLQVIIGSKSILAVAVGLDAAKWFDMHQMILPVNQSASDKDVVKNGVV